MARGWRGLTETDLHSMFEPADQSYDQPTKKITFGAKAKRDTDARAVIFAADRLLKKADKALVQSPLRCNHRGERV